MWWDRVETKVAEGKSDVIKLQMGGPKCKLLARLLDCRGLSSGCESGRNRLVPDRVKSLDECKPQTEFPMAWERA